LSQPDRAHEWRHDHGHQQQAAQQRLARKLESSHEPRQWQSQRGGETGRQQRDHETVEEGLALQWAGKKQLKQAEAEFALCAEPFSQQQAYRVKEKNTKKQQQETKESAAREIQIIFFHEGCD